MSDKRSVSHFSSLGEVFAGRLFQIPDYQRGYAWREKQWQDLLDDLDQLEEESQRHFFGTIILHAREEVGHIPAPDGNPFRFYDIVDGQQRLVTVTILLDVLAGALTEFDEVQAGLLREKAVLVRDRIGIVRPRLRLNLDTADFFQSVVLRLAVGSQQAETAVHQRLRGAKSFFQDYLKAKRIESDVAYQAWLEAQIHKLNQQLTVILYAAEQETDTSLIFAAMNDRGKPITEMEKVKSYLLYAVRKLQVDSDLDLTAEINKTWKHVYSNLAAAGLGDRRSEDQLLRAHWLTAYDPQARNWQGAGSIKHRFDLRRQDVSHGSLFKRILDYLETLRSAATTYCDIHNPKRDGAFADLGADDESKARILEVSKKLVRVGSLATFLPLLIAVRIRYHDNALEYLETAELCERFAFRAYSWRRWRSHTGQSRIYRLAHQLYRGHEIDSVQDQIRRLFLRYCTDAQFMERFQSETEDWYHWSGLKYFLYEYEQYLADQRSFGVQMQWDTVATRPNTIEHILPQTPDRGGYWSARFDDEEYERYKHDIGNLTLTFDNSPMRNKPFYQETEEPQTAKEHKWSYYFNSALFMEKDLTIHKDWVPRNIDERRTRIAEWASKRWHVEPPVSTPAVSSGGRKFSVAKIKDLADQYGVGELLDIMLDGFKQHGLGVRAWRWCITPAPPQGRQYALMVVYPKPGYLQVGVWKGQFPRFFRGISRDDMQNIIGPTNHRLDSTNINEFLGRLDQVFSKIEGHR